MKAKLSPLKIEDIVVTSSFFHHNAGTEEEIEEFFENSEIDFDFTLLKHKKEANQFKILLLLKINNDFDKKKPGYSIITTMEGVFTVTEEVSEEDFYHYKMKSALPIMISSLREHVYHSTVKYPEGPYELPSINLSDLIERKKREEAKKKKKTKSSKK